jgi:hypothetical protein
MKENESAATQVIFTPDATALGTGAPTVHAPSAKRTPIRCVELFEPVP